MGSQDPAVRSCKISMALDETGIVHEAWLTYHRLLYMPISLTCSSG